MWRNKWKFRESYVICLGFILTGILLQLTIGPINNKGMAWPFNLIACLLFFFLAGIIIKIYKHSTIVHWLGSYYAALANISGILLITLIMGLIRQTPTFVHLSDLPTHLGLTQILSTWTFFLQMLWLCLILYTATLQRINNLTKRNIPFLFNHLGILIIVVGMLCGSADFQQVEITSKLGKAECIGIDRNDHLQKLPIAIKLNKFSIKFYPPKLMIVDRLSGQVQPKEKPQQLLIDSSFTQGKLCNWDITLKKYLPEAANITTRDSVKFVQSHSYGSTIAFYIEAINKKTNQQRTGWLSCGNFLFPSQTLQLNSTEDIVISQQEPRIYTSDVTLYTETGLIKNEKIEVNKPSHVNGWDIYQLGFDEQRGKWSDISIFRLVHDPWLPVVYTGIIFLAIGAFWGLIIIRRPSKAITFKEEKS